MTAVTGHGSDAIEHRQRLLSVGVRIDSWDAKALATFVREGLPRFVPARFDLYPYQQRAVEKTKRALTADDGRALLILATGLGKTVIAGAVVAWTLELAPCAYRVHKVRLGLTLLLLADKVLSASVLSAWSARYLLRERQ